jgi:RimJ/RimL family protein N-acetyltransferase
VEKRHASQIAHLLNTRNQLVRQYTANMILDRAGDFLYELKDDSVIACVEARKVQWYQWEVCHLTVDQDHECQGYGGLMIHRAEDEAKKNGAKIIQCTIRRGNIASERAFEKNGYGKVSCFHYDRSGNDVGVWQKVLNPSRESVRTN